MSSFDDEAAEMLAEDNADDQTLVTTDIADGISEFISKWNLNADAQQKLLGLDPEIQGLVLRDFDPGALRESGCDGKFIMFASSIEKRRKWGPEAGQNGQKGGAHYGFDSSPPKFAKGAAKGQMGYASPGSAGSADTPIPEADGMFQSFCQQWGLNEDAYNKLHALSPAAQTAVMRQFAPKGEPNQGQCWSGKFIVFATQLDRSMRSDPVSAFIERWSLNQDAQNKLWELGPNELNIVLTEFSPPPSPDCNGKFIMFAKSIQNSGKGFMGGKDSGKGFMGGKGSPFKGIQGSVYGAPIGKSGPYAGGSHKGAGPVPYGGPKGGGNPYDVQWGGSPKGDYGSPKGDYGSPKGDYGWTSGKGTSYAPGYGQAIGGKGYTQPGQPIGGKGAGGGMIADKSQLGKGVKGWAKTAQPMKGGKGPGLFY